MDHAENLARVQAHRRDRVSLAMLDAAVDHVEDVLTRHAPTYRYMPRATCKWCDEGIGEDWPCPDYTSALALLDAIDRGE